eukprot:CAMPEP_0194594804 /NCGR_PEP_ID=MMETSP0292-20121207/24527_1 /TAXON_ID=39354 /ORGANISM="Heterosigma akashiwo, Strain CCMP2393" /LENGTH=150 /DNA_ID=CAMNT_0039454435 /DNA_START=1 /DNA_END=453 /DNA_ORIENTATION=-
MQTLHHILRQRGPDFNAQAAGVSGSVLDDCFFRGSDLALASGGRVLTYNSSTGFRTELQGTWGKKLIAFANDLAIFSMHTGTTPAGSHTPAPGSAFNAFCVRIISSQAEKYIDFFHVDTKDEKQIELFGAVVVDTMAMQESAGSNEASPS